MNYFEAFQYEHPGDLLWRSIELKMIDRLMQGLEVKDPILDLGCGNGEVSRLLFPNKKIYGVDITLEFVDETVHYGDLTRLDFQDGSFDTIFSNCVIEHISDLKSALSEVRRVLKKDGLFIFTATSQFFKDNLLFKNPLYKWLRCKRAGIVNHLSINDWYDKLKDFNLEIIRAEYFMDRKSALLYDKLAWIHLLGLSHQKYLQEMKDCYERDRGRWYASGTAIIARKK